MLAGMFLGRYQSKVLKPVVPLVPVDMVDKLKAS
jgi:hypothetical protein